MAEETTTTVPAGAPESPWRTPRRWILALVVPGLSLAAVAAVALALYVRGDTGGMSPWPGLRADPQTVLPREVAGLGLELLATNDASARGYWNAGHFEQGAMALYGVGADTVAGVWALRYPSEARAKQDFDGSADWFAATTGATVTSSAGFQVPGAGIRAYGTHRAAELTCRHRNWIVTIRVDGGLGIPCRKVTRAVREAINEHWRAGATAPAR
jgi:hypothetical protein